MLTRFINLVSAFLLISACGYSPKGALEQSSPSKMSDSQASTSVGMKFVKVPKGTFLMGSPSSESGRNSDEVQHRVTITYDFFVQTTEVTQEQWFNVMGYNPSTWSAERHCPGEYKKVRGVSLCPNNPVEKISWHDVGLFLAKMNEKRDGFVYRLPTEAQWEYAARGGSTGPYSLTGNLADFAWFVENAGNGTRPVAKLKPNAYGLYDVAGNVADWTRDRYGDYPNSHVTDPGGSFCCSARVVRGGGWSSTAKLSRTAARFLEEPDSRHPFLGVRLQRMPSQ
jgi:formylglycine-generating enzyme required for sulfatase activity